MAGSDESGRTKGSGEHVRGRAPGSADAPPRNVVQFDEQHLADASIEGSNAAFEQLYVHYFPKIRGFCLRKTSNPQLAEDIAQEAFVRAYERISDFGGPKHFGGWVGTIASNLVTDHYRRKRNTEVPLDDDEERGNSPSYEEDPVRSFQETDTARLVREALAKLEDRQRDAFLMHELRGLTCAAVGDQLGISETAAESLLARARRRLRKELTKQMTAKAAPAAIFNLGGLGLLPMALRAWRRAKGAAVEKATHLQAASARSFEQLSQTVPSATAAKGLIVAMGAALAVEAAGAVAPPPQAVTDPVVTPAAVVAPTPVPVDGDAGSGVADVPEAGFGDTAQLPGVSVETELGEDGVGAEGTVELPGPEGDQPSGGLDWDVEVGPGEGGGPDVGGEIKVRDEDGDTVLDSGRVDLGGR